MLAVPSAPHPFSNTAVVVVPPPRQPSSPLPPPPLASKLRVPLFMYLSVTTNNFPLDRDLTEGVLDVSPASTECGRSGSNTSSSASRSSSRSPGEMASAVVSSPDDATDYSSLRITRQGGASWTKGADEGRRDLDAHYLPETRATERMAGVRGGGRVDARWPKRGDKTTFATTAGSAFTSPPHKPAAASLATGDVVIGSVDFMDSPHTATGAVVHSSQSPSSDGCTALTTTPATATTTATAGTPATPTQMAEITPSLAIRYKPLRILQNSLFGNVQLAFDTLRGVDVAIKVSHAELVTPTQASTLSLSALAAENAAAATSIARSLAGVCVLEDVRREARLLRMLASSNANPHQPSFTLHSIDPKTCGLSNVLLDAIHAPTNAVVQRDSTNPLSIRQQFLNAITKGKRHIAEFSDEVECPKFHSLVSEFIPGGDLFAVLTSQPAQKVCEGVGRTWFYQMCCAVRYLHAASVAHLDLSLENMCLDAQGQVRLIDFGLATQHPQYAGDQRSVQPDGTSLRNASYHIRVLSEAPASSTCACCTSQEKRVSSDVALLRAAQHADQRLSKLKFLCRPMCETIHKPGKLGYMSPELYNNCFWDAYAHDMFALGVILYSILTGRPPFSAPNAEKDIWFKIIYSGQWLNPEVRSQAPAAIYNDLSPNAMDLINLLIQPQHLRPSIDQVLRHPWLTPTHPGNTKTHCTTPTRTPHQQQLLDRLGVVATGGPKANNPSVRHRSS